MRHILAFAGTLMLFIQCIESSQTREGKEPSFYLQNFIRLWAQNSFEKDIYVKDKDIEGLNDAWKMTMDALGIVRDQSQKEGISDQTVYFLYRKEYKNYAKEKELSEDPAPFSSHFRSSVHSAVLTDTDEETQQATTREESDPALIPIPEDEETLFLTLEEVPETQVSSNPESSED